MATKAERAYLLTQRRAELIARERERIKERVRFLRRHAEGFSATDGYDLRRVDSIRGKSLGKLTRYFESTYPHSQKSGVPVRPRGKEARRAIEAHVQYKPLKGVKTYWIETAEPERTSVHIRTRKVREVVKGRKRTIRRAEMRIERGGVEQKYYFFPEKKKTDKAIIAQAERMIATLPDGFYFPFTGEHELIAEGRTRDQLGELLRSYFRTYDKSFARSILGFRFVSTDLDDALAYQRQMMDARERRKLDMRQAQEVRRKKIRRQRRALMRGIKKP